MPESFAGTGPKAEVREPYEQMPDFKQLRSHCDLVEYVLEPGDCLVFDALTVHGAPDAKPQEHNSRRLTLRFAANNAIYRRRGSWTREMTDLLEREYGLTEGGPYRCDLLPILWSRDGV